MNIIKSIYTAEQLNERYKEVQSKVDDKIFERVYKIRTGITRSMYGIWLLMLLYGIYKVDTAFTMGSTIFAILGGLSHYFELHLLVVIIDYYSKREHYPFNFLETTQFLTYRDNIELCEKLLSLENKGKMSMIRKGDEQIVLYMGHDGKEETYPLFCPVTEENNTLDFSCYDEKIEEIMKMRFWPESGLLKAGLQKAKEYRKN